MAKGAYIGVAAVTAVCNLCDSPKLTFYLTNDTNTTTQPEDMTTVEVAQCNNCGSVMTPDQIKMVQPSQGTARKIKKAYIGVETPVTVLICPSCGSADVRKSPVDCTCMDCGYSGPASDFEQTTVKSVVRKIKKAYIGIGGKARPCWSGGELTYYGTATELSIARYQHAATTVGNYALFGGGYTGGAYSKVVDAYDTSLTRSIPTELSLARNSLAAATVGDYALLSGGSSNSSSSGVRATVDAYDTSLTRTTATGLSSSRSGPAATTVGNYALFGGGYASGTNGVVNAYDTSLTMTTATALSIARYDLAATTVGDYALFGGGLSGKASNVVNAYDTSLTRTMPTALSTARYRLTATTVGDCALFGGGYTTDYSSVVDAYNTSLTRAAATELSGRREQLAATTVGNYALFGGGYADASTTASIYSNIVDAYDASITRSTPTALSTARYGLTATTVGDYALFGGGRAIGGNSSSTVDVYAI